MRRYLACIHRLGLKSRPTTSMFVAMSVRKCGLRFLIHPPVLGFKRLELI